MILPFVRDLLADLKHSDSFDRTRRHLEHGQARRRIAGLTFTARALYLPFFVQASSAPDLVLVADNKAAEALHQALVAACELTGALDPASIVRLPAHDVLPFENLSPHPEIQETRAATLWKIASSVRAAHPVRLVVAPVEAACLKLFASDFYAALALTLRTGEEYLPDMLVEHLLSVGYTRVDVVEMPGQLTLRGGILDVYSPEADRPIRIDFFGDEIESIRKFDPETQRSQSSLDTALLLPLTEIPIQESVLEAINARLTRSGTAAAAQLEGGETPAELQTHVATRTGESTVFPGWEFFAPVAGASKSLLDLLTHANGDRPRVFIEEPAMIKNQGERWWNKVEQRHERSGIGNLIRPEDIYLSPWTLDDALQTFPGADLDQLGAVDILDADQLRPFRDRLPHPPHHALPRRRSGPHRGHQHPHQAGGPRHPDRAQPGRSRAPRQAPAGVQSPLPPRLAQHERRLRNHLLRVLLPRRSHRNPGHRPRVPIANGVQVLDLEKAAARQIVLFGANDLTDEADITARPATRKSKTAAFISDFRDLAVGDYVVHVEHGIAQYCGLRTIDDDPSGNTLELMILEFAEGAKLYVPLTRLDLIQKYRSTETGPAPVLNKLGSQSWQKTKARVKKAMADMAAELIKLYAARKAALGTAFSPDTNLQREFEDAFAFTETDDQLAAIADIKRDMESTQPMDRLLCGDVGYGKTEVAMRAAFKAVQDGKQVAVLTPTTVLSFQHFESFKRRFANFPVKVEMLSRFRTAKEKTVIVEQAEQGKIDVLIGTHAILAKNLKFQDLGLLVVDEEQRFGVRHKERLKSLRNSIDVLAMSATPIPRTLHMSLMGLRDMSVIETPPKDRMAIQTIVAKFDEKLIRTAIEMELERGGQVYFVNNRVETIYELAATIRELVPSARICIGHGQLPEAELERVMLAFMNHEYDVLVATSIIENGLDIPLANTIIVNRADRHGLLSELYQLRGRVGRSNRRAYAYLLIPPDTTLTEIARRRLAALKEFSDLGAGFKIAALDLELRGAGNMLGGEQSGHIEAIGFEMYTSMLEEAVNKLKGEGDKPAHSTTVLNLGISVRIDAAYIPEENQRLRMYKRIAGALDQAAIDDVRSELHDRYGTPPEIRSQPPRRRRTPPPVRAPRHSPARPQAHPDRAPQPQRQPQTARQKSFVEMLHLRFATPESAESNDLAHASVDPGLLMKLVARNANAEPSSPPRASSAGPSPAPKPKTS